VAKRRFGLGAIVGSALLIYNKSALVIQIRSVGCSSFPKAKKAKKNNNFFFFFPLCSPTQFEAFDPLKQRAIIPSKQPPHTRRKEEK
jgi:hypothetical protein